MTVPAPLVTAILSGINFAAIVEEISLDIRASLGILEAVEAYHTPPPPPPTTGGGAGFAAFQIPTVQSMNPTIQQNSLATSSGDPMLQLQSSLSPLS